MHNFYYFFVLLLFVLRLLILTDMLHLAETLFEHYTEYYGGLYGEDYITSNVHNLYHLVDEVKKLGFYKLSVHIFW